MRTTAELIARPNHPRSDPRPFGRANSTTAELIARPNGGRGTVARVDVVEITAVDTHDLRRRVLRNGTLSDVVVFDGDLDAGTFHLGVRGDDRSIIGVSTWLARPHPGSTGQAAHQLRGMATEPGLQRSGVGTRLLLAGLEACAERGSEVVWAHARSTALGFYERHGFVVCGDEYVEDATGLAHVDVVRTLQPG